MAVLRQLIPARRHFVVDTGYLDELYSIEGRSNADASRMVKAKFEQCIERRDILYVPFPVLYEFGRHIVEIQLGPRRKALAESLRTVVVSSCRERQPWVIPGADGVDSGESLAEALCDCCNRFADRFAVTADTLTDVAVIRDAERIKTRYQNVRDRHHLVHIWTRDNAVKACEPDREENPFV